MLDPLDDDNYVARFGPLPRSFEVQAGDVRLHLLEWGDSTARPVVMVHGMRGHARWFTPVGPAVGERYRALSVDLRGHGESEARQPSGAVVYGQDLVALIDAMDLREPILVGHSMGGSIAVRAAVALGPRLHALVTVDAGFGPPPPHLRAMLNHPPRRERRYFDSYEEGRARFKLRPGDSVADAELLDHLARHALRRLPDGRYTWRFDLAAGGGPPRVDLDASSITCPVIGIYGAESPIRKRLDPSSIAERFPSAASTSLDIVDGAHHHVFLDQPDAFNKVLMRRLSAVTG